MNSELSKSKKFPHLNLIMFGFLVMITFTSIIIPSIMPIFYPFIILGTWFHEMGHGLAAILMGGSFSHLQIFSDGSGVAYFTSDLFLGPIGMAFVAAAGPIAPTIAGALLLIASTKPKICNFAMWFLGFAMILSAIIWIRSPFGVIFMIAFGLAMLFLAYKSSINLKTLIIQFLGAQAFLSLYLSIGYLFSSGGLTEQGSVRSDTAAMQHYLFLPYWIWAVLILIFSAFLIYKSVKFVFNQNKKQLNNIKPMDRI